MAEVATLDGLFYQQYATKLTSLLTDYSYLQDEVRFVTKQQQNGGFYNQPVTVRPEASATYAAGTNDNLIAIKPAIGSVTQNAQIMGSQIAIPSVLTYNQMAKADSSTKAFLNATAYAVTNNYNMHKKRVEISMLYGSDLGTTSGLVVENTSTTATVTVSVGSWAAGIWAGSEGVPLNFYDGASIVGATAADQEFLLQTSNDSTTKTLVVSGTSAGIDALVTASANALKIVFAGSEGVTGLGINDIISTDDKFGINGSTYSLWRGNVVSVSGALSFAKVNSSLGAAVSRGGLMEDVVTLVNPNTFNDLTNEVAALRRYADGSEGATDGNKRLKFFGINGVNTIQPYALVKNGDAFVVPMKRLIRVGATDITFERQGATSGYTGKYFFDLQDYLAVQLRSFSQQAIFTDTPAKFTKITGFTNSVN